MKRLLKKTLWGYILTYELTFLIVIGLLVPIYSMAYNSSRRVIEQNLTSSLSAGTERLAVAVHAADLYAYSLMEQDEIVDIAYRANIKNSHLINAKQLQKKLIDPFSTSATLIKDVVVLFINSDYVISKGIVQTRDKYWGNLIGIRGMTQAQFESQLLERREQFFPLSTIQTVHMSISSPAICLNYFSKTRLKPYYAICAIIPESSIRDIVYDETVAQHGWMKITDAHGNVVRKPCQRSGGVRRMDVHRRCRRDHDAGGRGRKRICPERARGAEYNLHLRRAGADRVHRDDGDNDRAHIPAHP